MNFPRCTFTHATGADGLARWLAPLLPDGAFRRIVIKPNWVKHEEDPAFPISAMVTSSALIDVVLEACLAKYPGAETITVGDVPLQSCDWSLLVRQAGIDRLIAKYEGRTSPAIRLHDLRRERVGADNAFVKKDASFANGDPLGYREVVLDAHSMLDPVSGTEGNFRVSDYDPKATTSAHQRGRHHYLIAGTVLDADLVINLPKMKTHQKAGVTGALKNLVGINGQKAYLAHHRQTDSSGAGDEFPPDVTWPIVLQTRVRDALQGRSPMLFKTGRQVWRAIKKLRGIETRGTRENLEESFYVGAGSWYGNDTIWRMIYDLNRIVLYARRDGTMSDEPQRAYCAILDGLVAGEGNGPLQPLPVDMRIVGFSDDPFLMDIAMAQIMGFDFRKIPALSNYASFQGATWAKFDAADVRVTIDGRDCAGISSLPVLHPFAPAPGWRNHIELSRA